MPDSAKETYQGKYLSQIENIEVQWKIPSEGVQRYQNSLHFKNFPITVEGGVIENQFFPKFKKVQIILGKGGGVKKIMDFFHKLWYFLF